MASSPGVSSVRFSALCGAAVMVAAWLAPAPAHAFTMEGGTGDQWNPKFNIEEQAHQFSTPGTDSATAGKGTFDTPIGTMHFGVGPDAPGFGSPFGPSFDSSARAREDRRHFERMFTPFPQPEDGR
jgi:hypothetical protein